MIRVKSMLFSPAAFGIGIVCAVAAVFYVWGLMILFALVARGII